MRRTIITLTLAVLAAVSIIVAHYKAETAVAPYLVLGTLTAKTEHNVHVITISQTGEKNKFIHFSNTRDVLKAKGIHPLKIGSTQTFEGMNLTDIINQYGEPHADAGSGFYIPSYITEDAYLISFCLDSEKNVTRIIKDDLLGDKGTVRNH